MRVIAHISPGPYWIGGKTVYEQGAPIEAHLDAMRRRYDEGSVLLGGPYAVGIGGIAVLEVRDMDHAMAIMDADPGVVAGVLSYELRQHVNYFDAFMGVRTDRRAAELGRRQSHRRDRADSESKAR